MDGTRESFYDEKQASACRGSRSVWNVSPSDVLARQKGRVPGTLTAMAIILILAVALGAGVIIQSRWALLLPLGIGACVALAIAATGHGLGDTPIPFLVVVCTLVMVGGQGLRPQIIQGSR